MSPLFWSRRALLASSGAAILSACGREDAPAAPAAAPAPPPAAAAPGDPLEAAVNGIWRTAEERARDRWRHPLETLGFFGLQPGETVLEFWPGAGWYTQIVAPYLARTGGRYLAAHVESGPQAGAADREIVARYRERFANPAIYGTIGLGAFGPTSAPSAPPQSVDLVLFMRNLHNWMAAGLAEKACKDAYAVLKPGGRLGVEQHRAAADGVQDPLASTGYVQEAYVKQLAREAGFSFEEASEINANPKDDRDHPFGVWTLPPVSLSAPRGQPENPAFDRAPYQAVGESDRMTLRFVRS